MDDTAEVNAVAALGVGSAVCPEGVTIKATLMPFDDLTRGVVVPGRQGGWLGVARARTLSRGTLATALRSPARFFFLFVCRGVQVCSRIALGRVTPVGSSSISLRSETWLRGAAAPPGRWGGRSRELVVLSTLLAARWGDASSYDG